MLILLPSRKRPNLGRSLHRSVAGRRARAGLPMAAIAGLALAFFSIACSDDGKPAPETAGSPVEATIPDASVRDLPGEGLELTPDSDTDTRQRDPIGPERLNGEIDTIQNNLGGAGGQSGADASTSVNDAGAD
jgi:hypothetical protein